MGDGSIARSAVDFFFFPQVFKIVTIITIKPSPLPDFRLFFFFLQPLNVSCFVRSPVCVFREHLNKRLDARYW